MPPFNAAIARFEILSQNYADQQKNQSLNLPVVIRKEIDVVANNLGLEEEEIEQLRDQLISKYQQLLTEAITRDLDTKREGSDLTLRQLLKNRYGEAES